MKRRKRRKMMIKRDRNFSPTSRVNKMGKFEDSFKEAMSAILEDSFDVATGKNYVSDYLKALDAKSTETFDHSVNVATHVFNMMSNWRKKDGTFAFSRQEILAYTRAALLHDVGKLGTDIDVLHSNDNLRGGGKKDAWKEMMRHSIDGLELAKKMGFRREDIFISLSHHVNATSIEAGPSKGFENATLSRPIWLELYGEGSIEALLMENCSWIGGNDKLAAKITHFVDVVEALRSTERRYFLQHDWDVSEDRDLKGKDPIFAGSKGVRYSPLGDNMKPVPEGIRERNHGESVVNIVNQDINVTKVSKNASQVNAGIRAIGVEFIGKVEDVSWRRDFTAIQNLRLQDFVREKVALLSKDTIVEISNDKVEDVRRDPSCGRALMEERTTKSGAKALVFEDKRLKRPVVLVKKRYDGTLEKSNENRDPIEGRGSPPEDMDCEKELY